MANADARINIVIQNERSLSRVIGKIEQVGGLLDTLNKKQLNIFGKTGGVGGDIAAKQLKNLQDNIRNVANASGDAAAKARLLGNTFASISEKARVYSQVLENVNVKNGGLSRQTAEVKNLSRAWAVAEEQASNYSRRITKVQNDALRAEKGLQPQSVRDFEVAQRQRRVADRRRRKAAGQERFRDIATGAGFPLLFGGGPAQALAGGIGGAIGGLGGSIAASAIASQVQQFVQGIAEAGQALDAFSGDVGKIAEMTGTAGNESISYAKALEDLGLKQAALQVATQQAAAVIGTKGVGALQLFAEDTQRLADATARVGLKIQAFFAQALGGFTNLIAQIIEKLGGAKPADTGAAGAEALATTRTQKFNKQELNILKQEFAIAKMIRQEDQKRKEVAEARLNVSKLELEIDKEKSKIADAVMQGDIAAQKQSENAVFLLEKKKQILDLEVAQAVEAERVYRIYTAQSEALKDVVAQAQRRLNQEKAVAQGQRAINQAFFSAQLKINGLALQRAKQRRDINGALRLEIARAKIIYNQTLDQIKADYERIALRARELALQVKLAEAKFLEKRAAGEVTKDDERALKAKYEALKIANYNVKVQAKVAEYQERGAAAVYDATVEAAKFAAQQERAAQAAERTRRAMMTASGSGLGTTGEGAGSRGTRQAGSPGEYQPVTAMDRFMSRDVYGRPHKKYAGKYGFTHTPVAEGSYVTRPTSALVGERGENEYVIPESKMSSAIERYTRGARGESVVEGSGETSAAGRKRSGAVVNISTGPVMQMDGQDYVTVSDLNEAVGNVAAAMSSSSSEGYGGKARLN